MDRLIEWGYHLHCRGTWDTILGGCGFRLRMMMITYDHDDSLLNALKSCCFRFDSPTLPPSGGRNNGRHFFGTQTAVERFHSCLGSLGDRHSCADSSIHRSTSGSQPSLVRSADWRLLSSAAKPERGGLTGPRKGRYSNLWEGNEAMLLRGNVVLNSDMFKDPFPGGVSHLQWLDRGK